MRKKIITDWYLMQYVGAVCFIQTVLVTLWSTIGNLKARNRRGEDDLEYEVICESDFNLVWNCLLYALDASILCWGIYLAIKTRNVSLKEFNESKHIGLAIYNVAVIALITIPLMDSIDVRESTRVFIISMATFVSVVATLGIVYIPKIRNLHLEAADFKFTNKAKKSIQDFKMKRIGERASNENRRSLYGSDGKRDSNAESRSQLNGKSMHSQSTPHRKVSGVRVENSNPLSSSSLGSIKTPRMDTTRQLV